MRDLLGVFAMLAVGLIGPDAHAQNDPGDEEARKAPELQATLVYEIFELEQADWLSWTGNPKNSLGGPELREHVQQLLENGDATLAQLALIRSSPFQRAKSESVDEVIYQTEYEPDKFQGFDELQTLQEQWDELAKPPTKFMIGVLEPGEFETRDAGLTLEIDSGIDAETGLWRLETLPDWTRQIDAKVIGHGLGEVEMPIFNSQRLIQSSNKIQPGEIQFIGSTRTPESTVNLHFYRLDAHELPEPVAPPEVSNFRGEPLKLTFVQEWIEMEQADFRQSIETTEFDLGGERLRLEAAKLIEAGKARILETSATPLEIGKWLKLEAVDELMYPSEYNPPEFTEEGEFVFLEPVPDAMETRYVGYTVELESEAGLDARGLDLSLTYEHVSVNQQLLWGPADWKIEWPEFHTARSTQSIWLPFGERRLLSSFEMLSDLEPEFEDPRVLVFGRLNASDWIPEEREKGELGEFRPEQLGFVFEIFETTQARLDELLISEKIPSAGPELRDQLAAEGNAIETAVQTTQAQKRAKIESINEYVYPGGYDPGYFVLENKRIIPPNPHSFETRNLGLTIEFDSDIGTGWHIGLIFQGEFVELTGLTEHFKGEAAMKTPDIHSQRLTQSVKLAPGVTALLGTTRPLSDPENPDVIWVWFVRGDILNVPDHKP